MRYRQSGMKERNLQPELMDDPAIDPRVHRAALRGLARVNTISDASTPVAKAIRAALLEGDEVPERLSILDVATGSGDLPVKLAARLETPGLELDFHACDISDTALEATRERSAASGVPITTHVVDILAEPLPEADVVTCTLFMHHLTEEDAVRALTAMARAARRLLVITDLRRCRSGLVMAMIATQLFTRSRVVHVDAIRSVQGAFTMPELRELADQAGLQSATLEPSHPARMLLMWQPDA
jgi:2-polyprenyl-3-methyl-5-hydroxy-6-metoxy-1,4-benzoquinol methylase